MLTITGLSPFVDFLLTVISSYLKYLSQNGFSFLVVFYLNFYAQLSIFNSHLMSQIDFLNINRNWRVISCWVDSMHLGLWLTVGPWPLTISGQLHVLYRCIHCYKFRNVSLKKSRNIEQTTFFQRPAVWPWP